MYALVLAQKVTEDIIDGEDEGDAKVEEDLADMHQKDKPPMPASDKVCSVFKISSIPI